MQPKVAIRLVKIKLGGSEHHKGLISPGYVQIRIAGIVFACYGLSTGCWDSASFVEDFIVFMTGLLFLAGVIAIVGLTLDSIAQVSENEPQKPPRSWY
ncbi:MAG TPA: hypothetical protein VET84_02265 [Stellaceae bacterium]|jgi:hypothetical protein|nr:hypothetical protein [Stellaceae bacterium]